MNMRKVCYVALVFLVGITASVKAQVNIGSDRDAHAGALLELDASSVNKGLLLPRIAIADVTVWGLDGASVAGMVVFDTNSNKVYVWNGTKWTTIDETSASPVGEKPVTGVSVTPGAAVLAVGGTPLQLTATVAPSDATNQNVTWSSNNPSVATVNAGLVTAVAVGTAIITARTDESGFTATSTITVSACPGYLARGGEYTPKQDGNITLGGGQSLAFSVVDGYFTATGKDLCFYKKDGYNGNYATQANAIAACTNASYFDADAGSASLWRLPNLAELGAINDIVRSGTGGGTDVGIGGQLTSAPGTKNLLIGGYWSSTVRDGSNSWYWYYYGSYASYAEASDSYVRCVRSN